MGARQSRRAERNREDDGRKNAEAATFESCKCHVVPKSLEHVVYPRYREAFQIGLTAFRNSERTRKFARELPPIFGTAEFYEKQSDVITPVPHCEPMLEKVQKGTAVEQEHLSCKDQVKAYHRNTRSKEKTQVICKNSGNTETWKNKSIKGLHHPEGQCSPEKTDLKDSECDLWVKSDSFQANTSLQSLPSRALSNLPSPNINYMGLSRFTTPISEQLEEIQIRKAHMNSQRHSAAHLESLSLPEFWLGGGKSLKRMLAGDLQGGLFDRDERFSGELLSIARTCPTFRSHISTGTSFQRIQGRIPPIVNEEKGGGIGESSSLALDCDEELELYGKVYSAISQWQNNTHMNRNSELFVS